MTSYSNQSAPAPAPAHFASAPMLIAGDSDAALARAEFTVSAAGFRIGGKAGLEAAAERIAQQAAASAVWLDLDEDGGAALDRVLDQINRDTASGRYRAVIAAPAALIDVLAARIDDDGAELVTTESELPDVSAETVRAVIRARRLRGRYFSEQLFADPAWDMLLDLFHAEISQLRVPVSSLCIAAAVPATTALRWLKTLTDQGLFNRRADPHDGRRIFVELTPKASNGLRRYFGEVGQPAVI